MITDINALIDYLSTIPDSLLSETVTHDTLVDYILLTSNTNTISKLDYTNIDKLGLISILRLNVNTITEKRDRLFKAVEYSTPVVKPVKALADRDCNTYYINCPVTITTKDNKTFVGKLVNIYDTYCSVVGKHNSNEGIFKIDYTNVASIS